ncbi:MAG: SigE family RNA polymerase sigma factor [Actinomycetota bacterium]
MNEERIEGFDRLCRDEYARIVRTAYLITGDREEAMDLAQEAFGRAFARWKVVSQLDRPGAWLQRVVANLALSWRRRRRVRTRADLEVPDAPTADDAHLELLEALTSLTPAQRSAVVLRYYADQSVDQTARALGKKPGTVRALTSQGLARLREFLREEAEDDARR